MQPVGPLPTCFDLLRTHVGSLNDWGSTSEEWNCVGPLPPAVSLETESKTWRIFKEVMSVVFVLPLFYRGIRAIISSIVVRSFWISRRQLAQIREENMVGDNEQFCDMEKIKNKWCKKRLTIEVDGALVDIIVVGKPNTLTNKKWVLVSQSNSGCYEEAKLQMENLLEATDSNLIVFNYPGVGASSGFPHADATTKAYQAMLTILENTEWGIGAEEIIGYGLSLGSGVQGQALSVHELQPNIRYLFIKDQPFNDLADLVSTLACKCVGFIVKLFGNNLNSTDSSSTLTCDEIIMDAGGDDLMRNNRLWTSLSVEAQASKTHIEYAGEHGAQFPWNRLANAIEQWRATHAHSHVA